MLAFTNFVRRRPTFVVIGLTLAQLQRREVDGEDDPVRVAILSKHTERRNTIRMTRYMKASAGLTVSYETTTDSVPGSLTTPKTRTGSLLNSYHSQLTPSVTLKLKANRKDANILRESYTRFRAFC